MSALPLSVQINYLVGEMVADFRREFKYDSWVTGGPAERHEAELQKLRVEIANKLMEFQIELDACKRVLDIEGDPEWVEACMEEERTKIKKELFGS